MFKSLGIKFKGPAVPLEADPRFWKATKEEIDKVAQGCGPGKYADYLIPDTTWFGLSIQRACRIHDFSYYLKIDKALADIQFLNNMRRIIVSCTKWKWLMKLRLQQADLYYFMVSFAGDHSYAADKSNREFDLL